MFQQTPSPRKVKIYEEPDVPGLDGSPVIADGAASSAAAAPPPPPPGPPPGPPPELPPGPPNHPWRMGPMPPKHPPPDRSMSNSDAVMPLGQDFVLF